MQEGLFNLSNTEKYFNKLLDKICTKISRSKYLSTMSVIKGKEWWIDYLGMAEDQILRFLKIEITAMGIKEGTMPNSMIKSFVDKTGKSESELEKIWDDAKAKAKEQDKGENYAYITTIFKSMAGIKESLVFEFLESSLNPREFLNSKVE